MSAPTTSARVSGPSNAALAAQSFGRTSARILRHPANRGRRARAMALYLTWQLWERIVRRPWTIRLGERTRLRLYPHSVVAAFVLYYRVHDYEDLSFLRAYLRRGDLFVDVGANIGVYSLWAAETRGVEVVAFEPSSAAHARSVENVELNGLGEQVQVLRQAVGAVPAQVRLTVGDDAQNRLTRSVSAASESVEQTTLDAVLGSRPPAVVKIDVEGGELDVLSGARQSILRYRPALIIEVNDPEGLTALLHELGYRTWSYDPDSRSLRPAAPVRHANVLALADVNAARTRLEDDSLTATVGPSGETTRLPAGLKTALLLHLPFVRLLLLRRDFLAASGWIESCRRNVPVTRTGDPLPWYTYPAIDFLEGRVRPDMEVFEYGAGNSTLWWAGRVGHVSAVESDSAWADRLGPMLPENADLRFAVGESGGYAGSAVERQRHFDVVVIDGMERNACAHACLPALKDDGVIVWDNADWTALWADGMTHLAESGFRRIDFRGVGPLGWRPWTTSIFYRPGQNCLGL